MICNPGPRWIIWVGTPYGVGCRGLVGPWNSWVGLKKKRLRALQCLTLTAEVSLRPDSAGILCKDFAASISEEMQFIPPSPSSIRNLPYCSHVLEISLAVSLLPHSWYNISKLAITHKRRIVKDICPALTWEAVLISLAVSSRRRLGDMDIQTSIDWASPKRSQSRWRTCDKMEWWVKLLPRLGHDHRLAGWSWWAIPDTSEMKILVPNNMHKRVC